MLSDKRRLERPLPRDRFPVGRSECRPGPEAKMYEDGPNSSYGHAPKDHGVYCSSQCCEKALLLREGSSSSCKIAFGFSFSGGVTSTRC